MDLRNISLAFILPSLVFTGLAGYLADNFNKRKVLIFTKAFEIGTMGLAWLALRSSDFHLQLAVLFLLATQFTFFGPAKYSIVPELVENEQLSRANGLLEMSTFMAIILGSILAAPLFAHFKSHIDTIALVFMGLAVLGSPGQPGHRPGAGGPEPPAPAGEPALVRGHPGHAGDAGEPPPLADQSRHRLLLVPRHPLPALHRAAGPPGAAPWARTPSARSMSGWPSALAWAPCWPAASPGKRSSWAWCPWAAWGWAFRPWPWRFAPTSLPDLVPVCLGAVGLSAGLFAVPLNALLQQKAEAGAKGRIQAASNCFSTLGIIAAALRWAGCRGSSVRRPHHPRWPAWPASP